MEKQQVEQLIDRFIRNEMTPTERQEFCKMLEENKELKTQTELRMLLVEGTLIQAERKALEVMKGSRRKRLYLRITAACIIILLLGVGGIFSHSYRYSSQEIFELYYADPIVERARGENVSESVASYNRDILQFYEQKKYNKVVELYHAAQQSVPVTEQLPASTLLCISVSFIEERKGEEILPILLGLSETPYREEAEWLLLCYYLWEGNREAALQLSEKLKGEQNRYAEKAAEINERLKERRWF